LRRRIKDHIARLRRVEISTGIARTCLAVAAHAGRAGRRRCKVREGRRAGISIRFTVSLPLSLACRTRDAAGGADRLSGCAIGIRVCFAGQTGA
jgi:hypothetical protein